MKLNPWQLPQNILGKLVVYFSKADYNKTYAIYETDYSWGVSLGDYIIVNRYCKYSVIKHEYGHQKQSKLLGPLYLLVIGLPSVVGNIIHRFIKFDYYKQPWEHWADTLGGVQR